MMEEFALQNYSKKRGRNLLVLAFFILASLIFTYPLVLCVGSCVGDTADSLLNAWILAWDVRQVLHDPAAMFDANMFYPLANTLAYSESQFANALLASPILLATGQPILAHNFVFLFSFVFSGFGVFLLVEHLTGRWIAGVAAGIIFAFTPYRFSHFQIQMLATQWMPFALLYLDKAFRRQRWSDFLWLALFINLTVLSSYYYGLFFGVVVIVLGGAYLLILRGDLWHIRFWGKVSTIVGITAVINIPLALPYFSLADAGFVRSIATTELFKLKFQDFLSTTPENWLYGDWSKLRQGAHWTEHIAFPGIMAAILAVVALFSVRDKSLDVSDKLAKNRPLIWAYTAVFLTTTILAMGATWQLPGTEMVIPMPFSWLFNYVPGFQGLRAPSRFIIVSLLALAVLSGFGLAWLQTRWRTWSWTIKLPTHAGAISLGLLLAIISLEYLVVPLPFMQISSQIPPVYHWLAEQAEDSPVIELPFAQGTGKYISLEGLRLYYATAHWQPLVNGYSGFDPPQSVRIRNDMHTFPDAQSISRLNELGVRYVLFHQDLLDDSEKTAFAATMPEYDHALKSVAEFENTTVYEVQPQGDAAVRQLINETTFAEKLSLVGFGLDKMAVAPGEVVTVSLLWRAEAEMDEDYTAFVHVVDENGRLVAQQDLRLDPSTSSWQTGQIGRTQHILSIPAETESANVTLYIGLYHWPSLQRLPILDGNGAIFDDKFNLLNIPLELEN